MKIFRSITATISALIFSGLALPTLAEAPVKQLRLGYAPILSREILQERSRPLIDFFKQRYGVEVALQHSADFDRYLRNAVAGDFDLTVSQINYAAALQAELGFVPLVSSRKQFHVLVLKQRNNDEISELESLQGRVVGVPGGRSLVSALFKQTLSRHQLLAQVELQPFNRHDQLFLALLRGELDAAITVEITLAMSGKLQEKLEEVHRIPAGPAVFSASSTLNQQQREWLQQALRQFADSEQGVNYLSSLSFDGLLPISADVLAPYKSQASGLQQRIKQIQSQPH